MLTLAARLILSDREDGYPTKSTDGDEHGDFTDSDSDSASDGYVGKWRKVSRAMTNVSERIRSLYSVGILLRRLSPGQREVTAQNALTQVTGTL